MDGLNFNKFETAGADLTSRPNSRKMLSNSSDEQAPFYVTKSALYHNCDDGWKPEGESTHEGIVYNRPGCKHIAFAEHSLLTPKHVIALRWMMRKPFCEFPNNANDTFGSLLVRLTIACRKEQMPVPVEKTPNGTYRYNPMAGDVPKQFTAPRIDPNYKIA